jgi:uncharacterized protein YbbC (DUF1343 family)
MIIGIACALLSFSIMQAHVYNGIDVLVKAHFAPLQGHTIGLITNHTGHDSQRNATIDLLFQAPSVTLKALFSPEHGIRGLLDQEVINNSKDEKTGLPIYSLYGKQYAPTSEQLTGISALVFDIQDIGCRFYTYIATLGHCLEAAAKAHIPFFVLDRVNPINGIIIDGPVLEDTSRFVAYHTLALRHGMTIGELACMFNKEKNYNAHLTVIKIEGWKRSMWFDQTHLPWTNPSPNMRSLTQATVYAGIGLLEYCNISVGRGTDTPFEVLGAPYINDIELAQELQKENLPGVTFVPIRFKPNASIFKDTLCKGVNIIVLNREQFSSIDVGITLAKILYRLYKEHIAIDKLSVLLGHPATLQAIKEQKTLKDIKKLWHVELENFYKRRAFYLLY